MSVSNINLPLNEQCFVPFKAYRLSQAEVIWINVELLHKHNLFIDKKESDKEIIDWILQEFAYTTYTDKENIDLSNESVFYAERYGGQAINRNGGGSRAGLKKDFQVKGIGPNDLVGEGSEFWYSHGSATLNDMIQEALWGEVCHNLLPHGGVRCLAIIKTGIDAIGDNNKERIILPGGLVIRENSLRIAHFERAPYFKPKNKDLLSDHKRTKLALTSLKLAIDTVLSAKTDNIETGLKLLITRWATQLSYAKAIRLMHGAITSSNFSLDGKWIDFGSISTLGDHSNTIIGRGRPPFWEDHAPLYESITNLCFYINKFNSKGALEVNSDNLTKHFSASMEKYMAIYFVALTGLPIKEIKKVENSSELKEFYLQLKSVLKMGGGGATLSDYIPKHKEKRCFYPLEKILELLCDNKENTSKLEEDLIKKFNKLISLISTNTAMDMELQRKKNLKYRAVNLDPLHFDLLRLEIAKIAKDKNITKKVKQLIESRIELALSMRLL